MATMAQDGTQRGHDPQRAAAGGMRNGQPGTAQPHQAVGVLGEQFGADRIELRRRVERPGSSRRKPGEHLGVQPRRDGGSGLGQRIQVAAVEPTGGDVSQRIGRQVHEGGPPCGEVVHGQNDRHRVDAVLVAQDDRNLIQAQGQVRRSAFTHGAPERAASRRADRRA